MIQSARAVSLRRFVAKHCRQSMQDGSCESVSVSAQTSVSGSLKPEYGRRRLARLPRPSPCFHEIGHSTSAPT